MSYVNLLLFGTICSNQYLLGNVYFRLTQLIYNTIKFLYVSWFLSILISLNLNYILNSDLFNFKSSFQIYFEVYLF